MNCVFRGNLIIRGISVEVIGARVTGVRKETKGRIGKEVKWSPGWYIGRGVIIRWWINWLRWINW